MPKTVPTKPYDWTYTTTYQGHTESVLGESSEKNFTPTWTPANPQNPAHQIPLAELTRPDPILFYAEIPLFEDELHDNGSSALLVRIVCTLFLPLTHRSTTVDLQRVMPTCIFILSRFTLRVDGVLFRTYDTRMYHSFTSNPPLIVRETGGWEAPYDMVKNASRFPVFDYLPLT